MLGFATIGTNNIQESCKFYDVVLLTLGIKKVLTTERYVGYAINNNLEKIEFFLMKPFDKKAATYGNGTMIAFLANSRFEVDNFHKIAIENGAINEGVPGFRPLDSSDYYAYIRDFDGNKICAYNSSKA
jgi:predicted lactoylglutathione lyase